MGFDSIQPGVPDPMFDLKKRADSDKSPSKADLGVGIYRNELGRYHELESVRQVSVAESNIFWSGERLKDDV